MQAHTLLEGKLGFQSGKGGQQPGASSAVIQGGLGGRVQHQTGWGVDSPAMPTAGEGWSKSMATSITVPGASSAVIQGGLGGLGKVSL